MKEMKEWSDDMGEISGFGGGYEAMCRAMVLAGIRWIDEHPDADPQFKGFQGVYGLITDENDDAKALSEAIVEASRDPETKRLEATGAMHHASVNHVMAYKKLGWEEYCSQLKARAKE